MDDKKAWELYSRSITGVILVGGMTIRSLGMAAEELNSDGPLSTLVSSLGTAIGAIGLVVFLAMTIWVGDVFWYFGVLAIAVVERWEWLGRLSRPVLPQNAFQLQADEARIVFEKWATNLGVVWGCICMIGAEVTVFRGMRYTRTVVLALAVIVLLALVNCRIVASEVFFRRESGK